MKTNEELSIEERIIKLEKEVEELSTLLINIQKEIEGLQYHTLRSLKK